MSNISQPIDKTGLPYAIGCYAFWGLFPIYWKFLSHIDALETLMHRIIWSFIFYVVVMFLRVLWGKKFYDPVTKREWLLAAITGILMTVNWWVYIYSVNIGRIVEGSLAFFISPLMAVAVGVAIFNEPFPKLLKIAFLLALIGVGVQIIYGDHFPWIAIVMSSCFCAYGAIKKIVKVKATQFSMMETAIVLLPAIILAFTLRMQSEIILESSDWWLLASSGIVTGIPLLLFAIAAQRLPYSLMGMIQFIGPTMQFAIGVWVYNEPMTTAIWLSFAFIWTGVGLYFTDRVRVALNIRKASRVPLATPEEPR